jgi:hypothetical protein
VCHYCNQRVFRHVGVPPCSALACYCLHSGRPDGCMHTHKGSGRRWLPTCHTACHARGNLAVPLLFPSFMHAALRRRGLRWPIICVCVLMVYRHVELKNVQSPYWAHIKARLPSPVPMASTVNMRPVVRPGATEVPYYAPYPAMGGSIPDVVHCTPVPRLSACPIRETDTDI